MPIEVKIIKDNDEGKIGEIINFSKGSAKSMVEQGYAEYVGNKIGSVKEFVDLIDKRIEGEIPKKELSPEEKKKYAEAFKIVEGEKRKKESQFILDPSKIPQRIDHALGKIKIGEESFRYYGAKINEKIKRKIRDGKEYKWVEVVVPSDCLILENGRILSKNSKDEESYFEFDSIMTLKTNRWSLNSINDFCKGNIKEVSFSKVYNSFKEKYNSSMVYENKIWYKFNSLWDFATYFHDLIDKFLFIKQEGISGTAKSKTMKISANLSFNGKKFLCPNPANFFRYRHHNKATLMIEEAERLFDQTRKGNSADSELVEYLNGSYEKGNSVPRQNDKNINQTDEFDPAGFTRIGSISPLKGALEKRSVPLHMIKAPAKDPRGNVEVPTETDENYIESRNLAYLCSLFNYKKFEKSLKDVENKYNLANRQWVVAKPLIALAKCISPELEKEIGEFISIQFNIRDDSFDEESWERVLSRDLVKIFCKQEGEYFSSVEEIKNRFSSSITGDYKISNTKVGMLMSKLGFSDFKANPTGTQRGYRFTFFKLVEILTRQEWLNIKNINKIVSEVSECKFTKESIGKWYSDTYHTPYTIKEENEDNEKPSDTTDTLTLVSEVEEINFNDLNLGEENE